MMNHNTKFLKARILLAMFSLLIGFSVATPICVQASDYDIEWIGGTDNGSFDDLTTTAKETGNSFYKLLMALGVIGILCSVVICGFLIAVSQNANKRSEHISHIIFIMVGAILIFGAIGIVGMLKSIGGNIGG